MFSTTFIPIIIIMHIYTTGIIHCCNHSIIYIGETDYVHDYPLVPLVALVSPIAPFHLLGTLLAVTGSVHLFLELPVNCPLRFPHLPIWPPHPKSRPPGVSLDPNRHSLGRHCEPNPYACLHYCKCLLWVKSTGPNLGLLKHTTSR
jgi:hypothetical protein